MSTLSQLRDNFEFCDQSAVRFYCLPAIVGAGFNLMIEFSSLAAGVNVTTQKGELKAYASVDAVMREISRITGKGFNLDLIVSVRTSDFL